MNELQVLCNDIFSYIYKKGGLSKRGTNHAGKIKPSGFHFIFCMPRFIFAAGFFASVWSLSEQNRPSAIFCPSTADSSCLRRKHQCLKESPKLAGGLSCPIFHYPHAFSFIGPRDHCFLWRPIQIKGKSLHHNWYKLDHLLDWHPVYFPYSIAVPA